jgi:hypothetical protein
MTEYYLSGYVGDGSEANPFRPVGVDGLPTWSSIDLRPDGSVATGFALVAAQTRIDGQRRDYLGDAPTARSAAVKDVIGTRLSVTLDTDSLAQIALELLTEHAREDGTRVKPLREAGGRYTVWLGGAAPLISLKAMSGGSSFTESFDQANSSTLGPDLSWSEPTGNLQTVSNSVRNVAGGVANRGRADVDVDTEDMLAEIDVVAFTVPAPAAARQIAVCTRFAAAATTHYFGRLIDDGISTRLEIVRTVTGTSTIISAVTAPALALPMTLRLESNGSSHSLYFGGILRVGPSTDTNITGNVRGGVLSTDHATGFSVANVIGDNFVVADLAADPSSVVYIRSNVILMPGVPG